MQQIIIFLSLSLNTTCCCCNKYLVLDTVRNKWTTPLGEEFYENFTQLGNFI
jgi:hypothetical protein